MHSLYAKITFASTPLFPDVYFVSYDNCVFIVSSVAFLGYNICVCHLLSNKEISFDTIIDSESVERAWDGNDISGRLSCNDSYCTEQEFWICWRWDN